MVIFLNVWNLFKTLKFKAFNYFDLIKRSTSSNILYKRLYVTDLDENMTYNQNS